MSSRLVRQRAIGDVLHDDREVLLDRAYTRRRESATEFSIDYVEWLSSKNRMTSRTSCRTRSSASTCIFRNPGVERIQLSRSCSFMFISKLMPTIVTVTGDISHTGRARPPALELASK